MLGTGRDRHVRAAVVSLDGDVLDLLEAMDDVEVIGFLDPSAGATDAKYVRLGPDEAWANLIADEPSLKAVLAVDPPRLRARLTSFYGLDALLTIIAPSAMVSPTVSIGHGCLVQRGVSIGRNGRVGLACKFNSGAQIHHDSVIGNYCTIAPGARLLGNVSVGQETFIGSEAVILPHVKIGSGTVIGAGAVVTSDVPDRVTVKGVPGRW